jgi:hypothetical protein
LIYIGLFKAKAYNDQVAVREYSGLGTVTEGEVGDSVGLGGAVSDVSDEEVGGVEGVAGDDVRGHLLLA